MSNHRLIGASGEQLAAIFLENLGWKIIGTNQHFRFGEVDILAETPSEIVVVEVKAKRDSSKGSAVEMITARKKHTLLRLANWLSPEYAKPIRVDVVAIDNFGSSNPTLTHYPYAIEL